MTDEDITKRLRSILTMAARDKSPCLLLRDLAITLAVVALCAEKSNSVLLDKIAYYELRLRNSTLKRISIPPGPLLPKGVKPNDD